MDKTNDAKTVLDAHETPDGWTTAPDGWQLVEDNRKPVARPRPVRDEIPAGTFHGKDDDPGGGVAGT